MYFLRFLSHSEFNKAIQHVASSEGNIVAVQLLVGAGARLNCSDRWGGSPLDDALRHQHYKVAAYLRQEVSGSPSQIILITFPLFLHLSLSLLKFCPTC